MTTKILGNQITSYTIDTVQLSNTATAAFAKTLAPKVLYANVASNTFTVLDDTAVNVGGGYIVVTGAEFQSGATVLIDTVPASAVTYVNSTTLQVQVPTKSAASYNLYVVNPDGGVGIKVSGITYSSEPSWTTASPLSNQTANTAFNVSLSATGASSYSVAAGSTLPTGTTLAANGYFSGTVSIGAETTYTFSVVATDAENQDSTKTFQVTVTVTPAARLYVWGSGGQGRLGLNDTNNRSSPTQIDANINWSNEAGKISFGPPAAAIKNDGTLWMWGHNAYAGSLGLNDTNHRSSPTQVGSATNWSMVNTFVYTTAAIKTNGTLWTWGSRGGGANQEYGQSGTNNLTVYSSPVQIGSGTDWSLVSVGRYITAAIKTNGTLWTWGRNLYADLGLNDTNHRSSPTQVGSDTNWSKVSAGSRGMAAIKTDGTLWLWGANTYGQLGLNERSSTNYTNRSSPVQLGTDTNWSVVNISNYASAALKTNGTLWTWGRNLLGNLGLGDESIHRSSPTQIGSATNWSKMDYSGFAGAAIKTDGTLWTWGFNTTGLLGDNSTTSRFNPVQVGSATNWSLVNVGAGDMIAVTAN